jgi:hypothetical protein
MTTLNFHTIVSMVVLLIKISEITNTTNTLIMGQIRVKLFSLIYKILRKIEVKYQYIITAKL